MDDDGPIGPHQVILFLSTPITRLAGPDRASAQCLVRLLVPVIRL